MPRSKKPRGRPPKRIMPEKIDETPETVAKAFLAAGRIKEDEWEYLIDRKDDEETDESGSDQ